MTDNKPRCVDHDVLLSIALGEAPVTVQAEASSHLLTCAACAQNYQEFLEGVDAAALAAPDAAESSAAEEKAVESLLAAQELHRSRQDQQYGTSPAGSNQAADAHESPESPVHPPRSSASAPAGHGQRHGRKRRMLNRPLTLALAASLLILGVLGGVAGSSLFFDTDTSETEGSPTAESVPAESTITAGSVLRDGSGEAIGEVRTAASNDGPVLVIELSSETSASQIGCSLILEDGSRLDAGTWELHEEGPNTWVVRKPPESVTTVELLDNTGAVWATAVM